ncbi:hypothetical protein P9B03_02230 [Metasolibacillus meyeri]|uniref:Uncharacterized protein n=1 Tax=Metasolibacillus meyeri TaxID=1071052 RepID=A0AAW9NR13_9BACL|nr:hypothetical protein [Metasolibacillus meyeri]MEC1177288.1 hypothetical protein [Metasolibacillus meyeri]
MTIEEYLKRRNKGQSLEEIQKEKLLSEGTVWTLELGYQCFLKQLPLDKAVGFIQNIVVINPTYGEKKTYINPLDINN